MKIKFSGILVIVLLSACHLTKSVMIKNATNKPITLILPSGQKTIFFNDTIEKIQKDLDAVLHQSKMIIGKDTIPITDTRMIRYGLLIKELYVRIKWNKAKNTR